MRLLVKLIAITTIYCKSTVAFTMASKGCRIILITGSPGVGKTTVIQKCLRHLGQQQRCKVAGFYTRERRGPDGRRVGFEAVGLTEPVQVVPLATVKSQSNLRVGKYGVELPEFEQLVRSELTERLENNADERQVDLFVVDEIGKMECFSDLFVETMHQIAQQGNVPLLATVAQKGGGISFVSEIKQQADQVITVTRENRDDLPSQLAAKLLSD